MEAKRRHLPFQTANARLNSRFGIKMEEDTFVEKAYYIWRSIGNIATIQDKIVLRVPGNLIVELPAGVEFIESVTTTDHTEFESNFTGEYKTTSGGLRAEMNPNVRTLSEEAAARASTHYVHGDRVNYEIGPGNASLKLTAASMENKNILIAYTRIDIDEDGLPMLNDKEVEAIAANLALQETERDLFMNKPGSDSKIAYIKPLAERLLLSARISEKISDNGLDKILDIKTSWDRKVFGNNFNWTM